ncbi:MAG: cysteine desulfurase [Planctomycetota bacterium]|nr:MAG: cysteine desulfurase [Planctomycetota bacterium]
MSRPLIYLDHNATTPLDADAEAAMVAAGRQAFANPGSRHAAGRTARNALEAAREQVASLLGARPVEVVFTSGGTESNTLALIGLTAGRAGVFLAPRGEHPSIEETLRRLERVDWLRETLTVDNQGRIVTPRLAEEQWARVGLCTLLLAHNETGVVQDVSRLAAECRSRSIPFHLDGVQAIGKIPVDFQALGATTLSIGAHKFYGPRGIGALLVRDGTQLRSLLVGGHQERERRAGTEPVALAVGLAAALDQAVRSMATTAVRIATLRDQLASRLTELCSPLVVHGVDAPRLPNTLNVGFPDCDGEALLVALDLEGVCCSLGSTCASGASEPSPMLLAMGVSRDLALASVRFSLGRDNTVDEIEEAARRIAMIVRRQRATAR